MEVLEALIRFVKNLLKCHKKKILLAFFSAILFFVLSFPYNDLSALITRQVSEATGNQVFLTFDKMAFHFFPPRLKLKNVSLATSTLPPLKVQTFLITPSLPKLFAFQLKVSLALEGLWGGELNFTGELEKGKEQPHLSFAQVEFKNINLKELIGFATTDLKTSVEVSGVASGKLGIEVKDPQFKEQPKGELEVRVEKLVPPSSVSTAMGPLDLPNLSFSQIQLKVRLLGGSFLSIRGFWVSLVSPSAVSLKAKWVLSGAAWGRRWMSNPRATRRSWTCSFKNL